MDLYRSTQSAAFHVLLFHLLFQLVSGINEPLISSWPATLPYTGSPAVQSPDERNAPRPKPADPRKQDAWTALKEARTKYGVAQMHHLRAMNSLAEVRRQLQNHQIEIIPEGMRFYVSHQKATGKALRKADRAMSKASTAHWRDMTRPASPPRLVRRTSDLLLGHGGPLPGSERGLPDMQTDSHLAGVPTGVAGAKFLRAHQARKQREIDAAQAWIEGVRRLQQRRWWQRGWAPSWWVRRHQLRYAERRKEELEAEHRALGDRIGGRD